MNDIQFPSLQSFFESLGYNVDEYIKMQPYIEMWKSWYEGKVKGFHNYRIYNGNKYTSCTRYSLGMAKKVAESYSDLLLNEKVEYNIGNEITDALIKENVLYPNDWELMANEGLEKTFALGTGAFVMSLKGIDYDIDNNIVNTNNAVVGLEFVTADKIIPLSYEGQKVVECAFITSKVINKKNIFCVSIHKLSTTYKIQNYFFEVSKNGVLTLFNNQNSIINEYDTKNTKPWFWIIRPRITNNISYDSPYGISVYANAIDILKGIDIAYDSFINEFVLGKKRIFIDKTALKIDDDTLEPRFDNSDLVYYYLEGSSYDSGTTEPKKLISETDFNLRIEEHSNGIQININLLAIKVGLEEGFYKWDKGLVKTATEVISDNSSLFRNLKKHEIAIENALYELLKTVCFVVKNIIGLSKVEEEPEVSIDFDDSIIEDKQAIFNRNMILFQQGLISKIQFLMNTEKWSREQADEYVKQTQLDNGITEQLEEE